MATETTYSDAVDEMFGMINSIWNANSSIIAGYVPEIHWPGKPEPTSVPMDQVWARVSVQLVSDKQSSLANSNGVRRYHAIGLLYFQIFCPRTAASTLDIGRALANLIRLAFLKESPSGSIWFIDAVIRELPSTTENYPINIVVTFQYDSLSDNSGISSFVIPLKPNYNTKHFPVEPLDGIRTLFTFVGLPSNGNFIVVMNGMIQDVAQSGDQLTLVPAPSVTDEIFAIY